MVKNSSDFYVITSPSRGKILACYCRNCWKEKQRARYISKIEEARQYRAEYYKKNRDKMLEYSRNWNSQPERRRISSARAMQRLRTDEVAHFKHLTRVRIRKMVNGERAGLFGRMVFLLGCTGEQALKTLTSGSMKIPKGHHIDHYIPCNYFDLTNESHQRICFNWRNLRLIPACKNMEKSDTLPADFREVESEIRSSLSIDSASL